VKPSSTTHQRLLACALIWRVTSRIWPLSHNIGSTSSPMRTSRPSEELKKRWTISFRTASSSSRTNQSSVRSSWIPCPIYRTSPTHWLTGTFCHKYFSFGERCLQTLVRLHQTNQDLRRSI
jgi:hypothetical protein